MEQQPKDKVEQETGNDSAVVESGTSISSRLVSQYFARKQMQQKQQRKSRLRPLKNVQQREKTLTKESEITSQPSVFAIEKESETITLTKKERETITTTTKESETTSQPIRTLALEEEEKSEPESDLESIVLAEETTEAETTVEARKRFREEEEEEEEEPIRKKIALPKNLQCRGEYCVYLLASQTAVHRTYCGITNDREHRIRQHNGELVGGAKQTRSGRPWQMYAVIEGFASKQEALQFEWSCHHPHARRLRKPYYGREGRLNCVRQLFTHSQWREKPLRLHVHDKKNANQPPHPPASDGGGCLARLLSLANFLVLQNNLYDPLDDISKEPKI